MPTNYEILLEKIDKFIRRYYLNQLIKGGILFGAGFLILLLALSVIEYFGYLKTTARFVLFYGFVLFNVFVFIRYVLLPFFGLLKIGRKIKEKDASRILGLHFKEELNDKLTNALQLHELLQKNDDSAGLLMAGIDQKAKLANVIPFQKAINLRGNLRFVPFFILPLLVIIGFYFVFPALLVEPVGRIIRYDNHFERPLPFTFFMENETLGFKNENLDIILRPDGEIIPNNAAILLTNSRYGLKKTADGRFTYTVRNLQENFEFFVEAEGYRFGPFAIEVLQKPSFNYFSVHIDFPDYTRLPDETSMNVGDINVTKGSALHWKFYTLGGGKVEFLKEGERLDVKELENGTFSVELNADESFEYKVYAYNDDIGKGDSLVYNVQVRPDNYPRIQVDAMRDSVLLAQVFHRGVIQDDYGFDRLEFTYSVGVDTSETVDALPEYHRTRIDIDPDVNNQSINYHFDIRSLDIGPGETLEYYFVIYDNDGIQGPKATRSRSFTYHVPGMDEILAETRKNDEKIKEELSGSMGEVKDVLDEIDDLRKQMIDAERFSWEQQEAIRQLLDRQKEMEENIKDLSQLKKESEIRSEQFKKTSEDIRDKQDELQKIFDEVLSEEMKDLFEKIREELEKLDRDQIHDVLSRMDFEFKDLETKMDRALELYKQLEMERMLQESIEMLEQLKEEQASLNEETSDMDNADEMAGMQEDLKDKFESLEELLNDFREKNEDLSRPQNLDDTKELEEDITQEMSKASEEMRNERKQDAQSSQNKAMQKMEELSERLEAMQSDMFMEQMAEDSRALRVVLENLMKTSFSQEELLVEIREVQVNDPRYIEFIQEQRKIQNDLQMIEDSLVALSKRQAQIQSFVTREIREIRLNLDQAIYNLIDRQRAQGSSRQQFVMTHINNLALLLNESLQNMQMQMQMSGAGGEGMPQPGEGDPSFQNMRQSQEQLNEMVKQMQQGHQPLPGQSGDTPMSNSEAMARMAAEQEAIRNELNKMSGKMKEEGSGGMEELQELQKDMEATELDIVRKQINRQTILRQEKILTRLLEHERAEIQREMEERRVGNTANNYEISNPEALFEYNKDRNMELEMLRSLPPGLKPYYRNLVENYFLNVQE